MNFLAIFSVLLAAGVFLASVLTSTNDPMRFVDVHGILIVVGGTIAAGAISFQLDRALLLLKVFWDRTIRGRNPRFDKTIEMLMEFADLVRADDPSLKARVEACPDLFMRDALQLLIEDVLTPEELADVVQGRVETLFQRYMADANRFKALGKYPPAMGLMGAVLGMIGLLGGLGAPGAEKTVGPAMSIALIATLYGIAIANLVIIPIGENLAEAAREHRIKNVIILEGIKLIVMRKNSHALTEKLNSFLLPKERVKRKKAA